MLALPLAAGLCDPVHAQETETETEVRLREVEAMMQKMARELEALELQVATERSQREAAQAAADAAAATLKAQANARTQADAKAQPAPAQSREVANIRAQAQETREQLNAAQQRLDQQTVNARFSDGVYFEDPRGNWSVRLGGRAQLDYRGFNPDAALADTFSVRRARLGAQVTLFKDFAINLEGEFASGDATGAAAQTSQETLGYLEYQRFPGARMRFGQFKPQFGLEQTLLDLRSDFMERALTRNILDGNFLNYDRGVMVHGAPLPGLYYAVALTNGTGRNREEKRANSQDARADSKVITARLVYDFARLLPVRDSVFHFGVS